MTAKPISIKLTGGKSGGCALTYTPVGLIATITDMQNNVTESPSTSRVDALTHGALGRTDRTTHGRVA